MEKAIEIKRRAQRCILNGDLNGALAEYEKLVAIGDPDPYYCVLLADLLYKMGSAADAQKRYLEAIEGYAKSGLYKNGIAVCKKMSRLSLASIEVPRWLAKLYSQDGLSTEAGLAYQQLAEVLVKNNKIDEARSALQQAIQLSPDVARLHERLGEIEVLAGNDQAAGNALSDAAERYERSGQPTDVRRCRSRIAQLRLATPPRGSAKPEQEQSGPPVATPQTMRTWKAPEPGEIVPESLAISHGPPGADSEDRDDEEAILEPSAPPVAVEHGFGRLVETARASEIDISGDDEAVEEPAIAVPPVDEVDADEVEPDEDEADELEPEDEPAGPRPPRVGVPPSRGGKGRPMEIVGREATDYERDEEPETNGPVPAPVEDDEDVRPIAPPVSRLLEPYAPPPPRPRVAPPPAAAPPAGSAGLGILRLGDASNPAQPGLGAAPGGGEPQEDADLAKVSLILAEAQACFHSGDRDGATMALIRAAQAYDQMGRYDSAVAIYRSLGQSPDVSLQLMMLWLKNCQRRNDRSEGSRVACDLGDRALNDGDIPGARDWFERARSYDRENELAARRLRSIDAGFPTAATGAPAAQASAAQASAAPSAALTGVVPSSTSEPGGHVNVRTERDEPVVVDLGTIIEEFQRAIEPELASDPQGHYDLGMSYREMGLTEQAVHSLRMAGKSPAFRLRAGELAGRCLLDLGRFDEAADVLRDALQAPDLLPSAAVDLRYQLALALEAAGRSPEALSEFERVYAAQANYPDVAMKIRLLRKAAGAA